MLYIVTSFRRFQPGKEDVFSVENSGKHYLSQMIRLTSTVIIILIVCDKILYLYELPHSNPQTPSNHGKNIKLSIEGTYYNMSDQDSSKLSRL